MPEGMIVKALAGFYYVRTAERIYQCKARGVFKKRGISPLVGDRVRFTPIGEREGVIEEILPRSVELIRPPIANVDLAILVFSVREPELNLRLLDRLLVLVEKAELQTVIVLSKIDLLEPAMDVESVSDTYRAMGYPVHFVSASNGIGYEGLRVFLDGKISVVAGQSGVGKSSLLNAMFPELDLKMGEVSHKLGRGRHTTRHVELIEIGPDSFIADTPGFSQLDFGDIQPAELDSYFRDISLQSQDCYYRGCQHDREEDCAVRRAVRDRQLNELRYQHYLEFLKEVRETKEGRY